MFMMSMSRCPRVVNIYVYQYIIDRVLHISVCVCLIFAEIYTDITKERAQNNKTKKKMKKNKTKKKKG